jgi:hypothetical protein
MTSRTPIVPLMWYEHLLLRFLARSPRIVSIYVIQNAPDQPQPTTPARPPVPTDLASARTLSSHVNYLEALLNLPSPEDDDIRKG